MPFHLIGSPLIAARFQLKIACPLVQVLWKLAQIQIFNHAPGPGASLSTAFLLLFPLCLFEILFYFATFGLVAIYHPLSGLLGLKLLRGKLNLALPTLTRSLGTKDYSTGPLAVLNADIAKHTFAVLVAGHRIKLGICELMGRLHGGILCRVIPLQLLGKFPAIRWP